MILKQLTLICSNDYELFNVVQYKIFRDFLWEGWNNLVDIFKRFSFKGTKKKNHISKTNVNLKILRAYKEFSDLYG